MRGASMTFERATRLMQMVDAMTFEQATRFRHACALFDEMQEYHPERCERVKHVFSDLIRAMPESTSVYDCFVESVNDELANIECEMLLAVLRPVEGTA
jgi:hypothetical protein